MPASKFLSSNIFLTSSVVLTVSTAVSLDAFTVTITLASCKEEKKDVKLTENKMPVHKRLHTHVNATFLKLRLSCCTMLR